MNLTYVNGLLKASDKKIKSSDTLIYLDADKDVVCLGIIVFGSGAKKVIEFVKQAEDQPKVARLLIDETDLPHLSSVKMNVQLINGELVHESNYISLEFDTSLIKIDIKKRISNEYKELVERINKIEEKYKFLKESRFLDSVSIVNKTSIKKGMIPVAIDDEGHFVALYPFSNNIIEVNGQRAANGAVVIDSSMIKYKKHGKTIEKTLDDHATAIKTISDSLLNLSKEFKELRKDLNDLDMKISAHINSGII